MRQKGFAPILIVIVVTIVVIVAAYSFGTKKSNVIPIPTQTPPIATNLPTQPIPTPKTTLDPTMNWISFTSSKYKYSLKFPNTLFKHNQGNVDNFWVSTNNDVLVEENIDLSVGMVSGPGIDSLDKYISSNPLLRNYSIKLKVNIDGISGYKIRHIGMGGAEITYTSYVIEGMVIKNGVIYELSMASKSEDLINKYSSIFDQILSTFKFTN